MTAPLVIVVVLFYLGAMAELVSAGARSRDRTRLVAAVLAGLFTVVAARAVLPASPLYIWGWVVGVALFAAASGLALLWLPRVPWADPEASRATVIGSGVWITTLVVLTAGALWSFF